MSDPNLENKNESDVNVDNSHHDDHIHHYYHPTEDKRELAHRRQLEKRKSTVTFIAFALAIIGLLLFAIINGKEISERMT